MSQITLNIKSTSESFSINDAQIIYVTPFYIDGSVAGSNVTILDTASADTLVRIVEETPSQVAALTTALVQITLTSRETPYIAIYRIKDIITNGSVANIVYDGSGNVFQTLNTSMSTAQILAAIGTGSNQPNVYAVLLTQTGTDDPEVVVLENNIGTITITRLNVGVYECVATGLLTEDKTLVDFGSTIKITGTSPQIVVNGESLDVDGFQFITMDATGTETDEILLNTPLYITVYP